MRAYVCHVRCESDPPANVLAFCEGKEHLPRLVDAAMFPRSACGIEDFYEADPAQLPSLLQAIRSRGGLPIDPAHLSVPAAYVLADGV